MIPKKIISDFDPAAGNYFLYDADGVVRIESLDQSQPFGKALIERYNSHEELQQATKELKEALYDAQKELRLNNVDSVGEQKLSTPIAVCLSRVNSVLTKYKDL